MRAISKTAAPKKDLRTRQHLMERSFARGKRYGYDRSRWRGLWKNQVQEYMTAAIQNIEALIRYAKGPGKAVMAAPIIDRGLLPCLDLFRKLESVLLIGKCILEGDGSLNLKFQ